MTSTQAIVLITGANQGVGFETAKNLLLESENYHVLIGCRDIAKGEAVTAMLQTLPIKGTTSNIQIDVTDDISVDAAAHSISEQYGRLDILVNNAGMFPKNPITREAFRETLAVNLVGPVNVTEAFLPLLRKSKEARIVFVSSSTGSLTHASNPSHALYNTAGLEYRASKAGLSMVINQYHLRLKDQGIKVFGADPGLIATNLMGEDKVKGLKARGASDGTVGGERIATVIRGERDADVGRVCGEYGVLPW